MKNKKSLFFTILSVYSLTMTKNVLIAIFIFMIISCIKQDNKIKSIKEIEFNGDEENAQYIDSSTIIRGSLNNTKEEKDLDIYRLVYSNNYILSLSFKQNKNADANIVLENRFGREIFSLLKNNNIEIPLYSIKDSDIFLKIESSNNTEKIAYTLKIDFIEDYYNEKEVEPNNTFADSINIFAPDIILSGSFVDIKHNDRIPNQIITNIIEREIADVDIYRLRNPTDISVDIDIKIDIENMDNLNILLFDSRYNLISRHKSNSILLAFKSNTIYYIALVYTSKIVGMKEYKVYYSIKE